MGPSLLTILVASIILIWNSCEISAMKLGYVENNSGIILCGSNSMKSNILRMVWTVKYIWRSTLSIAICHCSELSSEIVTSLKSLNPEVSIIDICESRIISFKSKKRMQKRLRGFFCKAAALALSPFENTILVDTDVVFLQEPSVLLRCKLYLDTGALFFRDRIVAVSSNSHHNAGDIDQVRQNDVIQLLLSEGGLAAMNSSLWSRDQYGQNHYFWKAYHSSFSSDKADHINSTMIFPFFAHYQESSVLVLQKSRHTEMLSAILRLLPRFNIGHGDKEFYWIAATLAEEMFSFEPFLCAQYGSCGGPQLHYNPTSTWPLESGLISQQPLPQPFHINGENLLEGRTLIVGKFLQYDMTSAVRVLPGDKQPAALNIYNSYDGRCVCADSPASACEKVPASVNRLILIAQWASIFFRSPGWSLPNKIRCVPVLNQLANDVLNAFNSLNADVLHPLNGTRIYISEKKKSRSICIS